MLYSEHEKYPGRETGGGRLLRDNRSPNHYCALSRIARMRDFIGGDVYDDIKNNSQVGVILKLADSNSVFRGSKHVKQLLSNKLVTSMSQELWVLADGRPIRFSLHEFEHITHLKCGLYDGNDADLVYGDIWEELGLTFAEGPEWTKLSGLLSKCGDWSHAKRKMVGLLVVLHAGIFGLHTNSRIPIYHAKLVTDPERFERHPWGRVAFDVLIRSIRLPCLEVTVNNLHGLVHVLLVWAFEHIPRLGEMCGKKCNGDIPLLKWTGRCSRGISLEDVFEADKKESAEKKVRVVHLVEKAYEEMYPEWPGYGVDPKVDRMIRDILGGKLDETFWDVPASSKRGSKRTTGEKQCQVGSSKKAKGKEKEKKVGVEMVDLPELIEQCNSARRELENVRGNHGAVLRELTDCFGRLRDVEHEMSEAEKSMQETTKKLGIVVAAMMKEESVEGEGSKKFVWMR